MDNKGKVLKFNSIMVQRTFTSYLDLDLDLWFLQLFQAAACWFKYESRL